MSLFVPSFSASCLLKDVILSRTDFTAALGSAKKPAWEGISQHIDMLCSSENDRKCIKIPKETCLQLTRTRKTFIIFLKKSLTWRLMIPRSLRVLQTWHCSCCELISFPPPTPWYPHWPALQHLNWLVRLASLVGTKGIATFSTSSK